MSEIRYVSAAEAPLEAWQPDGVTVVRGNPDGHGFTLAEESGATVFATGVFRCEPATTTYELTSNEIVYVLEGSVSIALGDGEPVRLAVGDLAYLPKGHQSTWTFHEPFKEIWFLVG
ncbi:cupin domain-containing protein [Amycolatopsis sp. NPDC059090]|uniref:cupin domain-containing protein n=1 Tax=unclassified Amycolatopsis TaxID=2618356 RepID=UPI00367031EB